MITKFKLPKNIIHINHISFLIDSIYEYDYVKLIQNRFKNFITNDIFNDSEQLSHFIILLFSYNLSNSNIKYNIMNTGNYIYIEFIVNDKYDIIKQLNKLPFKMNQDIIDDHCDEMLKNCFNIENFKYKLKGTEYYIFSDNIKDKYQYLINANKFDLI
jgi:hypothetical protein